MIIEHSNHLNDNGFVVVDLLNDEELALLNALCNKYLKGNHQDFISSSHSLSIEDSQYINSELHKIVKPKTDILFPWLQLLGGTLATKIQGKSVLQAHRDWTIVDESRFNSYNLWIPLVDTNKENGTLGLVPGSHKWDILYRGFNIVGVYEKYTKQLLKIGYEPELKAGQAILYNHKLIHFSRPNLIATARNVAIIGMKDKEAELYVSFNRDGKSIETYHAAEEDFYGFDANKIAQKNQRISVNTIQQKDTDWTTIIRLFNENLPEDFSYLSQERKSFLSKLLDKFKFVN